jgi:hypothetical protein
MIHWDGVVSLTERYLAQRRLQILHPVDDIPELATYNQTTYQIEDVVKKITFQLRKPFESSERYTMRQIEKYRAVNNYRISKAIIMRRGRTSRILYIDGMITYQPSWNTKRSNVYRQGIAMHSTNAYYSHHIQHIIIDK